MIASSFHCTFGLREVHSLNPRSWGRCQWSNSLNPKSQVFEAWVRVLPDHLEVKVAGAPPLNVLLGEVGLKAPEIVGVGGPTQ